MKHADECLLLIRTRPDCCGGVGVRDDAYCHIQDGARIDEARHNP